MLNFILHRLYIIIILIIVSLLITWIALYSLKKKLDDVYENSKRYSIMFESKVEDGEIYPIEWIKPKPNKQIRPYNHPNYNK